jgi:carbon-monoxide dehydrogenase large subunit
VRRRNFIQPDQFPYETPIIWTYDSGDFEGTLEQAARHADLAGFEARRADAAAAGRLRGLGIGCYVKGVRFGMGETATLEVDQTGLVTIYIGNQSNGQGHATAFPQIVAAKLDIDIERVRLVQGDTDLVKSGHGTGGSRSLLNGGIACDKAAGALIEEGKELAADLLEVAAVDIEYADGTFAVAGTDRRLGLGEVADHDRGFAAENFFVADDNTYPNGCHIAEVEIDGETGETALVAFTVVDDYGVVVNPLLLEGQVHGGIAQGIGQALMEQSVYDESGQLVTGSLMDYCMPRADDLPSFTVDFNQNAPCRTNPMGIKGAGETGAVGAPAAVVHAVLDALAPLGIGHIDMPTTPERIWRAIRQAK